MRALSRLSSVILSVSLLLSSILSLSVSAVDMDNDGDWRDEVKGDCGIPASFQNVEYYDIYVPYKYNAKEIGGYVTEGTEAMTESLQKRMPGSFVNREGDMFNWSSGDYWRKWGVEQCGNTGVEEGYESDTGLATLTDKNGTVYYISALPWLPFREHNYYSTSASQWGLYYNTGQIFDVILTDGTVIHFVFGDAKAEMHTNGGKEGSTSPDSHVYSGYETENLSKHPQYANLYQAYAAEILEVWGTSSCSANFSEKYGLEEFGGDSSNYIAYIRMYNAMVGDAPIPVNENAKAVSYSLGSVNLVSGGQGSSGTLNISGGSSSLYAEEYFYGDLGYLNERQIALPNAKMLGVSDNMQIYNWKTTIDHLQQDKAFNFMRALVMFVGILVIVYSTLLFIAFQFDRINNFIDICLVEKITFGKLRTSPDDTSTYNQEVKKGQPKIINQRDVIVAAITGVMLGVLLLTGKLYQIIWGVTELVKALL